MSLDDGQARIGKWLDIHVALARSMTHDESAARAASQDGANGGALVHDGSSGGALLPFTAPLWTADVDMQDDSLQGNTLFFA